MTGKYSSDKQQTLDNYPIFMAMAEDVGDDTTGPSTGNKSLIEIGKESPKFIVHIN